ncbi:hypothetical protein PaeCFBP13512_19130 [Paenibacillus sp. CFBP13512]|uniref:DapH/DapD/GlmU-related protein n=1 Tax=Paenibacillus sp. CFBP13512 TaxID=2184007 RepID=UPI0010BFF210|nr:DapH/DapD/GlmU-related protein [Paenibacillus sp. CFBP13512]TKJ86608.1 hypothetical protein PaeCFBP13512_19130 [Paenibacillus sp. CFBP13512]
MQPVHLEKISYQFDCILVGENIEILKFGNLSTRSDNHQYQLTYIMNEKYLEEFNYSNVGAAIIHSSLKDKTVNFKSYLLTEINPETLFYTIFFEYTSRNYFKNFKKSSKATSIISSSAIIHDSVIIGNNCIIMDNVVLMPNTIIGDRVTIKPNTTIGGDGFQVKEVDGIRKVVPHVGGVQVGNDVEIGSNVSIDKGLFGEFTTIGNETKIDNQVYIGHSSVIGNRNIIAGGSSIAGNVITEENIWIGLSASINQLLKIGKNSFIGAHAAVIKSIKQHEKVVGVPSRVIGWVCDCRSPLKKNENEFMCTKCSKKYKLDVDLTMHRV